jgi:hypothetical protein
MHDTDILMQGGDEGEYEWWFEAPQKFLGDQQKMYNGVCSLRVGFWEYDGKVEILRSQLSN